MPTIKPAGFATSTDALSNIKFNVIPPNGAIINMWASGATAGDTIGLSIGSRELLVQSSEPNIESAADVIDTSRDQLLFNEVVEGGQLYCPVTATAEVHTLIAIRYL